MSLSSTDIFLFVAGTAIMVLAGLAHSPYLESLVTFCAKVAA